MDNIDIKNVFFSYDQKRSVLSGLNLQVKPNEVVGLLGANGSGKTTTFKLLSGLLRANEGSINIAGVSLSEDPKKAMKRCSYIPDETLLYPNFSALENMNLFAILWGVEKQAAQTRAEKLLKEVGLWDVRNEWVKSYSRGMKQKLSLCAGLLHEPRVLLMDEPFTGLDIDSLLWARQMLKEYSQQENKSILFTSHTPEVIETLASRVIILSEGKIIHDEKLNEQHAAESYITDLYNRVALKK
jgi:ABC-2 type transport system ATP-binding protein